jgi:hypothetical protein
VLGSVALVGWLFLWPAGPLTVTGRAHRQAEALARQIAKSRDAIQANVQDPGIANELARLATEADVYRKQDDPKKLESVRATLANLEARLRDEYHVSVVSEPGRKSGIDRYFTDRDGRRVSGYYVIVEARKPDGTVVRRRIHNSESGRDEDVTTWAERVPKEVYDRLAKDKKEDGILNETAFAVKRRGFADEEITMPGPDGRPLTRTGQITKW